MEIFMLIAMFFGGFGLLDDDNGSIEPPDNQQIQAESPIVDQIPLTTEPTPIPTPALLPGLVGMGVAAVRKRNLEQSDKA